MKRFVVLALAAIGLIAAGCGAPDSDVTQADVEKNKKDFSQEAYEDAMKKAGKGAELEEEKRRAAEYNSTGGQGGQ